MYDKRELTPEQIEEHKELQNEFMDLVTRMREKECDFPDECKLYYNIIEASGRSGKGLIVTAFLNEDVAWHYINGSNTWEGKWGYDLDSDVYESGSGKCVYIGASLEEVDPPTCHSVCYNYKFA